MPATITCPNCETTLRVREEMAGKKVKCPRCAEMILVPAPGAMTASPRPTQDVGTEVGPEEDVATVEPDAEAEAERQATRRCPACGKRIDRGARKCRFCKARVEAEEEEEDDEEERKPRGKFKPCPECGAKGAKRVEWTVWGSYYGPKLFSHVRCPECGYAYNGKTGGSNALWAALLITIPTLAILAIIAVTVYIILSRLDKI